MQPAQARPILQVTQRTSKLSVNQVVPNTAQTTVVAKPQISQPTRQSVGGASIKSQFPKGESNLNYTKYGQKTGGFKPLGNNSPNEKRPNDNISAVDQQDLKDILFEIGRLLLMTQIYESSHPIVKEKLSKLSILMIKVANVHGRLVLSNREDIVFLNGYQEKVSGGPLEKLKNTLKFLKVASFEFEKGITEPELGSFFRLVVSKRREKEMVDIKVQLKEKGLVHIKPIFLQYIEVDDVSKDVPKPQNVIAGTKHGYKRGHGSEEQIITDFLKGKLTNMPRKVNTFLLNHPKMAAMVLVKMLDEYEDQNMDSFAAFQAYIQSLSHYMARLSRLIKDPDKVEKTLKKLEKHLVVRLKSLEKNRKYINETKHQIKDALSWVHIEQLLSHYEEAKENLNYKEQEIVDAVEKRKVPSVKELKDKLDQLGMFESKLLKYFNEAN